MLALLAEKIRDEVVRLIFIDTTHLHQETYDYRDSLCEHFGIVPSVYSVSHELMVDDPEALFHSDEPDFLRRYKHEPKERMIEEL